MPVHARPAARALPAAVSTGLPLAMALVTALLTPTVLMGCKYQVAYRRDGAEAYRAGDYTRARTQLERALDLRPHDPRAALWMGRVELAQDNPIAAERLFEQALVLIEEDSELRQEITDELAEAIYQQNRPEDLVVRLRASAHDYGTARDYIRLGDYLARLSDPDGARVAYRQAQVRAEPGDNAPQIALARFYETLNDRTNALQAWREAWRIRPGDPVAAAGLRRLGVVPGPTAAFGTTGDQAPLTPQDERFFSPGESVAPSGEADELRR